MDAFRIRRDQIVRVAVALVAEEVGRTFGRHVDFISLGSWDGRTALGSRGLRLTADQRAACADRVAGFFDAPPGSLATGDDVVFSDWAASVADALTRSMRAFRFGTTRVDGAPQIFEHAADALFQDARAAASLLHGRRRVVSLVAPHNITAFATTILAPNLQGLESLDVRALAPEEIAETLKFGDLVVATPTLWRYLVSDVERLPDNVMGVSFAEPFSQDLAKRLRAAGLGAMREIYGTTENGLIAWRDGPSEAFTLFAHWSRAEDDALVRTTPAGRAQTVDGADALEWTAPRSFRLAGRRDGAVQIGAINVHPGRIRDAMRSSPLVEDADVRLATSSSDVARLSAYIVLKGGKRADEATVRALDAWCAKRLRPHERPRIYRFVSELVDPEAADEAPADG